MRVLIFSWRGPNHPNAGGAEISTHEYAKGWVNANYNVTLFTAVFKGCKEFEVIDGVNIIRRGRQIFGVQWEAFKWYLFKDHPKYDLVIDQFHGIPFFTSLYVRVKKLAFIHEVTKEVWKLNQFPSPFNLIVYVLGMTLEPLIFQLYKKIPFFTVSESTKKDLTEWGIPKENITVIHNGVNKLLLERLPPKETKKTIMYLGVLAKDKGVEDALRVFSILNITPNWQFWIAGKADPLYLKELKLLSGKLGVQERVKFWGFVSEQKKFELLSRAHILVNPSIREGWGLVVIEAAAVGTPTVGYKVAGLKDSIIDNQTGILTKQNTPIEMAEDVLSLMTDQPRYIRMCHYAKKWSDKFSWANSIEQSLSLLKKVYEESKGDNAE